jgi:signal transduction histidine kinase
MGGQISVRSVPGEGTIFTLDLPTRLTEPLV